MSSVETGQMSAVETGQMSAPETGHLLFQQREICPVSREDIYPFSTEDITAAGLQQNTSSLLEEQKSVLSQQFRLLTPQIRGWAQNDKSGPKWVENGRQDPRMDPNESYSCSGAFGTCPATKIWQKSEKHRLFGVSRWGHLLTLD